MRDPTYVIAEMGSTHDGDLDSARRLVGHAADSGADAVKAQFWSSADRLAERRHATEYLETYRTYQIPVAWLETLADAAARRSIEFMCTVYLPEDIAVVAPYVSRFKIASFEAGDQAFIRAHLPYKKPIIVSTGLMTERDVYDLNKAFAYQMDVLYCVSGYPTPLDELNLVCLRPGYTGLSDHSGYVQTGGWAVMRGARIIEVHFRGWLTKRDNPDFRHSLDPDQLTEYVRNIRAACRAFGSPGKCVRPSEQPLYRYRVTEGTP